MSLKLAIKNYSGDTIVEVMIALAVLGLAFGISYATANRSIQTSQSTQEHSLALEYLDSQAEAINYLAGTNSAEANEVFTSTQDFCLSPSTTNLPVYVTYSSSTSNVCNNFAADNGGVNYSIYVHLSSSTHTFHIYAQWPGLGSLGIQKEEISYRVYQS